VLTFHVCDFSFPYHLDSIGPLKYPTRQYSFSSFSLRDCNIKPFIVTKRRRGKDQNILRRSFGELEPVTCHTIDLLFTTMDLSHPLNRLANNTERGRYIDPDSLETLGVDEESQEEHELATFWTNNFGKGSVSSMQQVKEVQGEKGEKLCAHFLPLKDRNSIPTAIYNEEARGMLLRGDYHTCYTRISSFVMHPRRLGPGVDVLQEKNKEVQSAVDEYMDEDMNGFALSDPPPEESMESEEQTVKPIPQNMEPTSSATTYRALEEQSIARTPAVGEPIPPNMEPITSVTTCRSFKEAQVMLNVDEIQFPAQGPTGALFIISGHPGIGEPSCHLYSRILVVNT